MAEEDKKVEETAQAEEKKDEAPAEEDKKSEEVEVPAKFKKLIEEVESMTVLELHELVKVLEKKFGVSASAVAVAGPAVAGDGDGAEQSDFAVELTSTGDQKIAVIKIVKDILALGLKEAKDLVESAPVVLKEGVKKENAEEIKAKIEGVGGKVTLK
jgi:large subunit ribosomal protein L7/L12